MIPRADISDLDRAKFLEKLWQASRGPQGILLSPWEVDFVASFKKAYRYFFWLTDGRRVSADELRAKFGALPEIAMPMPLPAAAAPVRFEADPGGCMFLVRDEGRQQPCNQPAEFQEPGKLRYCRLHAEAVELVMKRQGKRIALIKFP